MTAKSDFSTEEWQRILEAPPSAGMIVVTAQRGGTFRETIAMAKAYTEARRQHGESELLDEIVAAKPERDHTHYHSPKRSSSMDCSTCATRSPCSTVRRRQAKWMSIASSSSRWPIGSLQRTVNMVKR